VAAVPHHYTGEGEGKRETEIGSSIIMHGIETNTTITPYIVYATNGARKRDF
jgi:hypothetical protein